MNIFEGITKEKFIEEFNKEENGILSLMHINLAFNYKSLKKKKVNKGVTLLSIANITNYFEEIEVFNSFKPFIEDQGKPVLIVGNYNKYLSSRNKLENKLIYVEHGNRIEVEKLYIFRTSYYTNLFSTVSDGNYKAFNSVRAFNKEANDKNLLKLRDNQIIELSKLEKERKDKVLSHLHYCFASFMDRYKIVFKVDFLRFESFKKNINLTKKELRVNFFFEEFIIYISDKDDILYPQLIDSDESMIIDDYLKISTEILENIQDVAEYLDCNIKVFDLLKFSFVEKQSQ